MCAVAVEIVKIIHQDSAQVFLEVLSDSGEEARRLQTAMGIGKQ